MKCVTCILSASFVPENTQLTSFSHLDCTKPRKRSGEFLLVTVTCSWPTAPNSPLPTPRTLCNKNFCVGYIRFIPIKLTPPPSRYFTQSHSFVVGLHIPQAVRDSSNRRSSGCSHFVTKAQGPDLGVANSEAQFAKSRLEQLLGLDFME